MNMLKAKTLGNKPLNSWDAVTRALTTEPDCPVMAILVHQSR